MSLKTLCKISDLVPGDLYFVVLQGEVHVRYGTRLLISRDDTHYVYLAVHRETDYYTVERFPLPERAQWSLLYMKINLWTRS